ncbi:uncharacterized protein [Nicotiana tomentosiformis]|uniref:uncharacterized protein n=1 Tax=Nicotiana tomentosiformis TaxID=4098 RepID=UPI00388CCBBE
MPTPSGKFTVGSAWHMLRHRELANPEENLIWTKGLPFKISFFYGDYGEARCRKMTYGGEMNIKLFQNVGVAFHHRKKHYNIFFLQAQMPQKYTRWNATCCSKLKQLFQAALTIISWEIWKRRNAMKHEGRTISVKRVVHEVNNTLHQLAKLRFAWLGNIPFLWLDKISFFESYKPVVITKKVTWQFSSERWFKCNTDGASRGNPRPSSYGFCVRNHVGDHVIREGNFVADFLDNLSFSFIGSLELKSFNEFATAGKTLINKDKS